MRIFLRVLLFVVLTAPFTWLWVTGVQDAYVAFVSAVAGPVLEPLGVREVAQSPARERFISYVPYLVLMVVTPGLSLRRRAVGVAVGLPLIFLCHVGLVAVEGWAHGGGRENAFSTLLPAAMFADAFPFVLWALVANPLLRDLFGQAFARAEAETRRPQ